MIKKVLEILKKDKEANYNDFVILVRANDSAIPFIKALERAGLPYQFLASRGLYSKPVILDVISYFKLFMLQVFFRHTLCFKRLYSSVK